MQYGTANCIRSSLSSLAFWYQSLVTNLNMEKQLNELSKAPIEIRLGFMQTPGLPKDGKCISLPRNLLPETQYVLSSSSGSRVSEQSLVTNLNMEKQLNELSKAPIEIRLGFMQTPGLPKDGKCISLPRNLLPETQYVLSSSSGSRVSKQVCYVQATLNNITEILSWIALHQTPEHNQANIERSENITKLLEKQFTKIIEILEQNRKNIKNELEIIQKIDDKRYETLFANQQRIINLFLEKALREEDNKQLDTEIRELKDIITELRKGLIKLTLNTITKA
ncbi:hypothetical protein CTI12_AA379110 [Artemisia annua]|uniref:Uncharacterized protein n=1 Tax=Artemisia annua TaxID=35608 RepID=A0A2U1M6W1_ARTAN|nr:hypothetical protein CTI12_AA379110 [Artemisia annua]